MPDKILKVNYEVLSKLSLSDEIALLEFLAGQIDADQPEMMYLINIKSSRPLDIKETARERELSEKISFLSKAAEILNNRVSDVINRIFEFSTPTAKEGEENPLAD